VRPDPYSWTAHPEAVLGVAAMAGAYVLALRGHPAPLWRIACFALGALLLTAISVTPVDSLTFHLLTMHLLQNVVLAEWAPALLVLALPPTLAARLTRHRASRTLTHPAVALPVWLGTYFVWHLPPAYDTALEHPATLLHLEHACYLAAGVLLWWPVLQDEPHRLPPGTRTAYVFGAFVLASPLGLLLALLPSAVYDFYADGRELWGMSPLTDQQIAGITMATEQAIVFFAVLAFFFYRFVQAEERAEAKHRT
jgi:cytochrome c oxidase assembly factor CtaG